MRYDLATLAKRTKQRRRKSVTLRDIPPPATLATDLYSQAYAPVIAVWAAAIPRIMAEYERTLANMTTDTAADIMGAIEATGPELTRMFIILRPLLDRLTLRTESWQRGKWRGAVLSATGVDVGTLIGPSDVRATLGASIERNVALIRDISDQARGRISDAVFRGLNERRPAVDVAKDLREAADMGRARARRVASDQLTKLTSALADERRREAGIDTWEWKHSGKRHPRADHVARDGKVYADTAVGAGGEIDGQSVNAPPEDRPGQLPFCGCRSRAVIDLS